MMYEFLEKLQGEELLMFKRCVRKLLDSTFIVANKDPVLYEYLTSSSNRVDVSSYLKFMGYDIAVDDEFRYAMLIQNDSDIDTVGLKRSNHVSFSNNEVSTLLVLWLLFLERVDIAEESYVEFGEVVDMQKQYAINISPNELKNALKIFRRFSLINFNDVELKEDTVITLYPTLQFTMNKEQFFNIVKEMAPDMKEFELEDVLDAEDEVIDE